MIPSLAGFTLLLRRSTTAHAEDGLVIVAAAGEPNPGTDTKTPTGQPFGSAQPVLRINTSAAAEGDILAYWTPDGGATWFEGPALGDEVT
jgi:hypothetical protein